MRTKIKAMQHMLAAMPSALQLQAEPCTCRSGANREAQDASAADERRRPAAAGAAPFHATPRAKAPSARRAGTPCGLDRISNSTYTLAGHVQRQGIAPPKALAWLADSQHTGADIASTHARAKQHARIQHRAETESNLVQVHRRCPIAEGWRRRAACQRDVQHSIHDTITGSGRITDAILRSGIRGHQRRSESCHCLRIRAQLCCDRDAQRRQQLRLRLLPCLDAGAGFGLRQRCCERECRRAAAGTWRRHAPHHCSQRHVG